MRLKKTMIAVCFCTCLFLSGCMQPRPDVSLDNLDDLLAEAAQLVLEGKYEEAIVIYEAIIEIEPKNTEAYLGLANVYRAIGNDEGAARTLQRGIDNGADSGILLLEYEELIAPYSYPTLELDGVISSPNIVLTPSVAPSAMPSVTPSVVPPQLPQTLAFEWTYNSIYGWVNTDSFRRECISVIVIFQDLTLEIISYIYYEL